MVWRFIWQHTSLRCGGEIPKTSDEGECLHFKLSRGGFIGFRDKLTDNAGDGGVGRLDPWQGGLFDIGLHNSAYFRRLVYGIEYD